MPYVLIDVVLTPEELDDKLKKIATTKMLEKVARDAWKPWLVAGLLVTTFSSVGLWAASGRPKASESV